MYLLDTNVLSELRKQSQCNPLVTAWIQPLHASELYVSVLTLGEIRKGVELIAKRDLVAAAKLDTWLCGIYITYADHILDITASVAEEWGRMNAIRPLPAADGLIAATAKKHDLTLVTRNIQDFRGIGVRIRNPFELSDDQF
ncbi:MAG TPA: type II toxin-antitoxin system VapC family toxin [Pirellula sp.]|nr:type II toxin-antitoxin system VapC family toxin [Pirellula sp.]